jgi:copper transport protein
VVTSARNTLAALAAILVVSVGLPASAAAHAQLQATDPPRGATVKTDPGQVEFRFNEPVESAFGAVRVYDPKGNRVDTGAVIRPHGQKSAGVKLKGGLPNGSYTATYHVISADSHPVSGGFVFSIGAGGPAPTRSVAELTSDEQAGKATGIAFGIDRGLQYAAIAIVVGGLAFGLFVWLPALGAAAGGDPEWRAASEAFSRRFRLIVTGGLVLGVLSCAAGIVFQGATASGISFFGALDPSVVREVLGTRFGTIWGLRLIDWLLVTAGIAVAARATGTLALRPAAVGAAGLAPAPPSRAATAVLALPILFLVVSPALAGHAASQSPSALLVPMDTIHVAAMSVWFGGLVLLVAALPRATGALPRTERSRLLAEVLVRFSPLALAAVIAIAASGTVQAIVHVQAFHNLIDTAFGRAVLIKIALLLALVALGAWNRQRAVPAIRDAAERSDTPGAVGVTLRRSLRAEVALIVVVLGVTSALVSYAPPSAAVTNGPYSSTKTAGPVEVQMTVDPSRVGANTVHLYLLQARTGAPFAGTKELKATATLPSKRIGPLPLTVRRAGPGHYVSDGAVLAPAGKWTVSLQIRVSDFDEYTTNFTVPIR